MEKNEVIVLPPTWEMMQLVEIEKAQLTAIPPTAWPQPIPVADCLPEDGQAIIWFHHGQWQSGSFEAKHQCFTPDYDGYGSDYVKDCGVTHWLPMPPNPE